MKLTPKIFFYVMVGLLVFSIGGGGAALYLANGLLKSRSDAVVELKLQNRELEEQVNAYRVAKKSVEKYSYLNEMIQGALPQDKDQARTVREIFLMAESVGIKIKSVQFPTSTLGTRLPGTPAAATTPSAAASAITQAVPVVGLNGVYGIETIVTPFSDVKQKVSYDQVIKFLGKIESNRRAMQVSDIEITPIGQNESDGISFTLTLNIFIKP